MPVDAYGLPVLLRSAKGSGLTSDLIKAAVAWYGVEDFSAYSISAFFAV